MRVGLLQLVRAAGIPTALVTSTGRQLVEIALETLGRDRFDVVVCGDEVVAPKPDPEPYLTAARLLGVPIERCVAIEDSPAGVASAVAAGAAVLAVPSEVPLDRADGVHLLESLTGADLELLARLVAPLDLPRSPAEPQPASARWGGVHATPPQPPSPGAAIRARSRRAR